MTYTIPKEMVDQSKRIAELEQQNAELKAQVNELRDALKYQKDMQNGNASLSLQEFLHLRDDALENSERQSLAEHDAEVIDGLIQKETTVGRMHDRSKRSFIFCQDAKRYAEQLRKGEK